MEENMIENKKLKKKMAVLTISLVAMIGLVLILGTYALWQQTRKQTNRNVLGTACLDISIEDESSALNTNAMWPTNDTDGANLTPYTFTVTNNCNQSVNYMIALESLADEENQNPSYVANNYVRVKIDDKTARAFSALPTITSDTNTGYTIRETRKIMAKPLGAGASRTHNLRIWLDENTPMSEINKSFFSKVKIIGGQGIEVDCYEVDSEGTIIAYDNECGKTAVIPATVNGVDVVRISNGAFKGDVIDYIFNGEASSDNNPLSSPDDFGYLKDKKCRDENNAYVACQIDFSIVYSENVIPFFGGEEPPTMEQIQALTSDDIYAIIYTTDSARISAINNYLDDFFEEMLEELPLTFTADDIKYYRDGVDKLPPEGTGIMEEYQSLTYDGYDQDWDTEKIGSKIPSGSVKTGLVIDNLDLTQATNLERIDSGAFANLPDLNRLPANQISIDPAFGLKSITYNDLSGVSIGCAAFAHSDLLELTFTTEDEFAVVSNQEYNGGSPVEGLNSLNELEDANDILCIYGANPFASSSVKHLTVNATNSDTTVGEKQFDDFGRIGLLTLGNGITSVGDYAFGWVWSSSGDPTYSIYELELPNSLTTMGVGAFRRYYGNSLTIPSGITAIPQSAFQSYNGNGLTIPSNVTSIGQEAFENYKGSSLTFNEGLQSIGNGAFKYYSGDVTIPYSVTSIGNYAFASMYSHNTVTIKRAQADVPYSLYTDVWGYYHSLPTFVYDP